MRQKAAFNQQTKAPARLRRELLEKIVGLDVEKRRAAEQIINILSGL